jgi:hypothetical protein
VAGGSDVVVIADLMEDMDTQNGDYMPRGNAVPHGNLGYSSEAIDKGFAGVPALGERQQ